MKVNTNWVAQRAGALYNRLYSTSISFGIYKGTMPAASAIASGFTASNYTSDLLFAPANVGSGSVGRTNDDYLRIFLSTIPADAVAVASGTATWFAVYLTTGTSFAIIGEVSEVLGDAPMKLLTTNIVSGQSYSIYSFAFKFKNV